MKHGLYNKCNLSIQHYIANIRTQTNITTLHECYKQSLLILDFYRTLNRAERNDQNRLDAPLFLKSYLKTDGLRIADLKKFST